MFETAVLIIITSNKVDISTLPSKLFFNITLDVGFGGCDWYIMDLLCVFCWVIGGLVAFFVMVKFWYRYTSGQCTSKRRMDGKTVIVTGSNTGIGKETALELAKRGARVILACRDPKRGTQAKDDIVLKAGNKNVYFLQLDLSSLKSVRNFVAEVKRREKQLHVLINNAAAAGVPNRRTADDLQQEMQINHFGPFLLTILLIDLLKSSAPSRVVILSSLAHKFAKLELDNLNNERWHSDMRNVQLSSSWCSPYGDRTSIAIMATGNFQFL
ncbi:hypothetical protein B566_EDAN007971 [Ephemera danica]|nr:hypothetical protein B566_EDAN007971 [Ephemera danica]